MAVYCDDDFSPMRPIRPAPPPPLPLLMEQLVGLTAPDRAVDWRVEQALNTSSIHSDHLDRFRDAAEPLTASAEAVAKYLSDAYSAVPKGWSFTGFFKDQAADQWTVTATGPNGESEGASHKMQAVAACIVALKLTER